MFENIQLQMFKCQRCGKCLINCPVLAVTEWDSFSPRARVILSLAKEFGHFGETKRFLQIIFSCTTCRICENVCPAGVKVVDIILHTRERIVKELSKE